MRSTPLPVPVRDVCLSICRWEPVDRPVGERRANFTLRQYLRTHHLSDELPRTPVLLPLAASPSPGDFPRSYPLGRTAHRLPTRRGTSPFRRLLQSLSNLLSTDVGRAGKAIKAWRLVSLFLLRSFVMLPARSPCHISSRIRKCLGGRAKPAGSYRRTARDTTVIGIGFSLRA